MKNIYWPAGYWPEEYWPDGWWPKIKALIGKATRRAKLPFTPPTLDFEKVRQDWKDRVARKEEAMWVNRIQHEEASRKILVAAMLTADEGRQAHIRMQIRVIELRIRDLQAHLAGLKSGLRQ